RQGSTAARKGRGAWWATEESPRGLDGPRRGGRGASHRGRDRARPMEEDRGGAGQGRGTRGAAHRATAGRAADSRGGAARTATTNAGGTRIHTGECQPARSLAHPRRGQVRS